MIIDVKHILKGHAYQNIPLNYEEAYNLGLYVLLGCNGDELAQRQSIAILCALHTKATYAWQWNERQEKNHGHRLPKNAAEQIAGICATIFEHDIAKSEFGFVNPDVSYVMDNCGMGGEENGICTANISTIAGLIAAVAGIPMCKHGSPANTDNGKYGSSDFISKICKINNYATKEDVEKCIEQFRFGYTEACDVRYKKIHKQTHEIAMLPHMNDIIGPITNPLNPKKMTKRVLGVNHLISPKIVAETYKILNEKGITNLWHGLFVRGFVDDDRQEVIDEVSICASGTQVAELKNGRIKEYNLFASDFGVESISKEAVQPIGNKGEYSLKILQGKINGDRLNIVLANAALLFYLAEKSTDLKECYQMAEQTFQSGKPYEIMLAVKRMLPIAS
ncbi:anthranilate phosphoribosyltransferase [Patescibacteria group bacterium]